MPIQPFPEHHALLRNLAHEVFQTETSASQHCRREAERYPGTPLASALLAVARHADGALEQFAALAETEDLPGGVSGGALGETFSKLRDYLGDRMLEGERSYRATLLGIRHGTDVIRMVGHIAAYSKRDALAQWAHAWLGQRTGLLLDVEDQLAWFAPNIERAREGAK